MRKFIKSNSFISPKKESEPKQIVPKVKPVNVDYSNSNYVRLLKNHEYIKNKFNHFF